MFPDISRYFQMFPDISRCFQLLGKNKKSQKKKLYYFQIFPFWKLLEIKLLGKNKKSQKKCIKYFQMFPNVSKMEIFGNKKIIGQK